MSDFTRQFIPNQEWAEKTGSPPGESVVPDPTLHDYQASFATALGIQSVGMIEVIIADLCSMIKKEQRHSLEGYVICLARIESHKIAWECINSAFSKMNEKLPSHFLSLFNQTEQVTPPKSTTPTILAE